MVDFIIKTLNKETFRGTEKECKAQLYKMDRNKRVLSEIVPTIPIKIALSTPLIFGI